MTKALLERLDDAAATGRGSLGSTIHDDPLADEAAKEILNLKWQLGTLRSLRELDTVTILNLKQELRNLKDDVAFIKARGPGPSGGWG